MKMRRLIQILGLVLFWGLLWHAASTGAGALPPSVFLQMDPALWVAAVVSARNWISPLWPAPVLLLLTVVWGRFFCGWFCPLGTSIDALEWILGRHGKKKVGTAADAGGANLGAIRYHILFFVIGAAAAGLTLVSLVSPLVIATKVHGLLLFPMLTLAVKSGLTALRPAAELLGATAFGYTDIEIRRYGTLWLTVAAAAAAFGPSLLSPRFWCRYLCPAGAVFSLFSRRPLFQRRVSDACTQCGKCRKACPADAIPADPVRIDPGRCIVCGTCEQTCPVDAVAFRRIEPGATVPVQIAGHRRRFLFTGLAGAVAAAAAWTGVMPHSAGGSETTGPPVIRPPGARPEADFLARCVRCGLCIAACPTNTLQPLGLDDGLFPLLSPAVSPRRAPCEPLCNVCGGVCATDAIRLLYPDEKQWAKIGTASIVRQRCVAWELDRKCLVCDEVCPYDAVELRRVPGNTSAVPFVLENRCSGCGYCEYHCPVRPLSAIVVRPEGAIRVGSGSVKAASLAGGNDLRLRRSALTAPKPDFYGLQAPEETSDLPPGFSRDPESK